MVAATPLLVFAGFDAAPEPDSVWAAGAFVGVACDVIPAAVLQSHGENIHDGMIQSLTAGIWIEFLRVIRTGANHLVRVMASVNEDFFDL